MIILVDYLLYEREGEEVYSDSGSSDSRNSPAASVSTWISYASGLFGILLSIDTLDRHGQECLLHEGSEVLSGTKYVLRSDIMFMT